MLEPAAEIARGGGVGDAHGAEGVEVDLVGAAHTLAAEMTAKGFGSQLLAATFKFEGGEHPVYWIYGFKRGAFWPFVPIGDQKRDNATELELKAKLEQELPVEQDLTRWLALFDAPV